MFHIRDNNFADNLIIFDFITVILNLYGLLLKIHKKKHKTKISIKFLPYLALSEELRLPAQELTLTFYFRTEHRKA